MAQASRTTSSADQRRAGASAANHGNHDSHGHSTAAWTLVGLCLLGALVISIAIIVAELWLALVGIGIVVVGLIAGKVLQAMGFGEKIYDQSPTDPGRAQGVK